MLREVDKSFFAMGFEPGSLEEGATVGLGWRGGELLVEVDGGEFVGGGDVRLVHEKKSNSRNGINENVMEKIDDINKMLGKHRLILKMS